MTPKEKAIKYLKENGWEDNSLDDILVCKAIDIALKTQAEEIKNKIEAEILTYENMIEEELDKEDSDIDINALGSRLEAYREMKRWLK